MLVGLLDYDALPPDRMGWNRDAIRAIEAEAALLAPPVEPDPHNIWTCTEEIDRLREVNQRLTAALRVASHSPHDQAGGTDHGFPVCSVCGAIQTGVVAADDALPALLARRAPGDRGDIIRAGEALVSVLGHAPADCFQEVDICAMHNAEWSTRNGLSLGHCEWIEARQAVVIEWRALAADSRPEQPAPLDVERLTAALWGMDIDFDASRMAGKIAAAYDALPPQQDEPPEWVVQHRVHESQQRSGEWMSMPAKDEADGREWFDRYRASGVVIEARLICKTPTVVAKWREPVRPEEPPE